MMPGPPLNDHSSLPALPRPRFGLPAAWQRHWHAPGGGRELVLLAMPLILSNSVWTLQITLDRIMLSRLGGDNVAAAMAAVALFWTPLTLFQTTASYATTFVAQYTGAGRPDRVGPVIWQALYFSVVSGIAFLGLAPLAEDIVALGGHSANLQVLEAAYLRCLCFSALPTILTAAVSSFFAGRGQSWVVLAINAAGLVVNGFFAYAWIFGAWGFPALGIEGAGWATVVGTSVSALVGIVWLLLPRYRSEFHTLTGWRFDRELFRRLMRFGLPSGLQWFLEGAAFTVFLLLVGRLGDAELAATSIAFTLNLVAVLPAMGMAQAVAILVGQRLGEDRPDLAASSTWTGFALAWTYMSAVALVYVLMPGTLIVLFRGDYASEQEAHVANLVPVLLRFVAVYSLFDSMNLVFAFALKGAGDTRFVTLASIALAWPIMVLPTWAVWYYGWGLDWAWTCVSAYVIVLALVLLWRFRAGQWRSMRVIEKTPVAV
ncbi:MAG: MATE family efflux transporter [Gemmataceae bacterium]|nr:MATE family efflux transporter [Gemmataceae bacterium]